MKAIKLLLTDEQIKALPVASTNTARVMLALGKWAEGNGVEIDYSPLKHGGFREVVREYDKKRAQKSGKRKAKC